MVTYDKRIMPCGFAQTGGDTETQEFIKILTPNTIETGGDTNAQISIALGAVFERCKWVSAPWHPNTLDWTGGTYTWRWRVTTAQTLINLVEVIVRRVSNDCQTVKASKSSGTISVSFGSTGVKSGTISWNDGTQNPVGRSADDRFEILFRLDNTSTMAAATTNVGFEHTTAGNDDIDTPFSETAETATNPTGFCKTVTYQKPASGTIGVQTISVSGAGRIKAVMAVGAGSTDNTGAYQDAIGFAHSYGIGDGNANQYCQSNRADDAVATANNRNQRSTAILLVNDATSGTLFEADIIELGTDEFKINIVTNTLSQQVYFQFIVFCGSDLQYAYCNHWLTPDTTTGNKSATHVTPFISDFIIFNPINSTSINSGSGHSRMSIGFAKSSTVRGALRYGAADGVSSNSVRHQRSDRCIMFQDTGAGVGGTADFVSRDTAGFTVNVTQAFTDLSNYCAFLAFKGGTWDIGAFDVSAGTGNQTVNTNVSNLAAEGLVLATVGSTTNNTDTQLDHARMSIGFADSITSERSSFVADTDAAATTQTANAHDSSNILRVATEAATASSSTTEIVLNLDSISSGSFTVNKSTNTGTLGTIAVLWVILGVVVSGQNITRTATETVTISESLSMIRGKTRARTETVSISESLARAASKSRSKSESITISESASRVKGANKTKSESVTISESLASPVRNKIRAKTESVTISESAQRQTAKNRSLSESVTVSESLAKERGVARDLSESVTISESLSRLKTAQRSLSESVVISETLSRLKQIQRLLSDSITISEALGYVRGVARSLSETVSISESLNRVTAKARSKSESVTISESLSKVKSVYRTISESVSVIEQATRLLSKFRSLSESLTIAEVPSRQLSKTRSKSESVSISESLAYTITQGAQHITRTVTETVAISESLARQISKNRAITEIVSIAENPQRMTAKIRSLVESIAISESAELTKGFKHVIMSLAESVIISESLTRTKESIRSLIELVEIKEKLAGAVNGKPLETIGRKFALLRARRIRRTRKSIRRQRPRSNLNPAGPFTIRRK